MKKSLPLLFFFCAQLCTADLWTPKSIIAGMELSFSFSFTIGNKGYFGTGWKSTTPTNEFWEYNPALDAWTQKANFGGAARWTATGFSIGDKGYAGLGCTQTYVSFSDFWQYDTTANAWTQKAGLPATGRGNPNGFNIGNYGYIFGGFDNGNIFDDLWQYDPVADTWSQKTSLTGMPLYDAQCFVIGTSAYIVCGIDNNHMYSSSLWQYDAVSDAWIQKANLPSIPRCDAAAFSLCGFGYEVTGETGSSTFTSQTWQYEPVWNVWTQKTMFPGAARDESTYFSINGKGYIGYGANQGWGTGIFFTDFWEYTPDNPCSNIPTALFSSVNSICPGTCADFNNLSVNATSYQWNFPGATPSSSTSVNPTNICYFTPGNYDVMLVATSSFGSDTLTIANYITVFPNPAPQAILQIGDTLFANAGAASYQWYYNGNIINGATQYYYFATQDGDYNIICNDTNGCEVEAAIFDVDVAVEELFQTEFEIYPVPTENTITIKTGKMKVDRVMLCNAMGEKIMDLPLSSERQVDLSSFASGVYFIMLKAEGKIFWNRIVKY